MFNDVLSSILDKLVSGGPTTGWLLAAYLFFRLHQLTDRQHKANIATIRALTTIKTLLLGRGMLVAEDDE